MKISCITTVFNEELTIEEFLLSLFKQTLLPDEIIIVDAGSNDNTINIISRIIEQKREKRIAIFLKKGNRSIGRNEAIQRANGDIIVSSDVGCILHKDWMKNIIKPFENNNIDIVAGYYSPITKTIFEKCLATYTCVMQDKVDKKSFLPSSRSIAFKKIAWQGVGGYPKYLDTCEDLVFAKRLKQKGYRFYTALDAIVFWPQRENIQQAWKQFFSYAKGDGTAMYIRPQTPMLFLRYVLGICLLVIALLIQSEILMMVLVLSFLLYLLWSIQKNYQYVRHWKAWFILPTLQLTADTAVITGMILGIIKRWDIQNKQ